VSLEPAKPGTTQAYHGRFTQVRQLNPTTSHYTIRLDEPNDFSFLPGQFAEIHRGLDVGSSSRAYSIASTPADLPNLEFIIKRFPKGELAEFLGNVKVGDPVLVDGPHGEFLLAPSERYVFVATGTGIAPIRSMLGYLAAHAPQVEVHLILGARTADELYLPEAKILDAFTRLNIDTVVSDESNGWTGARGRVTQFVSGIQPVPETLYYLCGNPNMVKEVRALLESKKVDPHKIKIEFW
jgi:benzoate/toluate 1,2-dioxygenase reductase subunit